MKKLPQVALVAAGSLGDSLGTHLVNLPERLGPIKSTSARVASRLSNALRAGQPVADYEALDHCELVFVSVPDEAIKSTIAEMAAAAVSWKGRLIVLWSKDVGVEALDPLVRLGAEVASLCTVPGFDHSWFLLEGSKPLERRLRPLLGGRHVRIMLVGGRQKAACVREMGELRLGLTRSLRRSAEKLRDLGVSNREMERILERLATSALRSCLRSRRHLESVVGQRKCPNNL